MQKLFFLTSGFISLIATFFSLIASPTSLSSQEVVQLKNPSFEGVVRQGGAFFYLDDWIDCGQFKSKRRTAPDIHPGNFWGNSQTKAGIDMPPSAGRTYLGMVARDDGTYESVSQQLDGWLKEDQCYIFSVDMLRSLEYWSGLPDRLDQTKVNFKEPAVLRVWGSNSVCWHDTRYGAPELLVESASVKNTKEWQTNIFMIKPKKDYKFVTLEVFYKTPTDSGYNGHILVDNASDFVPIECDDEDVVMEFYEEREQINRVNKKKIKKKQAELIAKQEKKDNTKNNVDKPKKEDIEQPITDIVSTTPSPDNQAVKKEAPLQTQKTQPKKAVKTEPKILTKLNKKNLSVGQTVKIEKLYFRQDTTLFKNNSVEVLTELADFLNANKSVQIEIGGHTNGIPDHDYCDALSLARADTVADYLISQGVDPKSLKTKGYGKRKPVASNNSVAGRALNQRVEITILQI